MNQALLNLVVVTLGVILSSPAVGASISGSASVNLVNPLSISEATQLTFGNITNLNGSCEMQDDGLLVASGGQNCSGAQMPAEFTITGDPGNSVDIVVQANNTEPGLSFIPKLVGAETKTLSDGSISFQIVGTININNAFEGTYAIPYVVTVNYQ